MAGLVRFVACYPFIFFYMKISASPKGEACVAFPSSLKAGSDLWVAWLPTTHLLTPGSHREGSAALVFTAFVCCVGTRRRELFCLEKAEAWVCTNETSQETGTFGLEGQSGNPQQMVKEGWKSIGTKQVQ